jgi:hypothetical protein
VRIREGWPVSPFSASIFPEELAIRSSFWYPCLLSCPESGSSTTEETSLLEINMKYDHSQGGNAWQSPGWLWAA